ncbi:MAG TPA: hypothetical protein VKB80_06905, partial [Kofleriaceae bacterium]|nr:hypothetical protein [Kofleriaceae bacterium]
MLRARLSTLCLCALSPLLLAACAKATIEDRGRGTDEDASSAPKPVLPDARPPVLGDAGGRPDASDRDAGPAPDADCSAGTSDLLTNGNLDEGAGVGWGETSAGGFPLVVADGDPNLPAEFVVTADTAPFMIYLGGYDSAVDQVQEDLDVPAGAAGLHLRGAARIDTLETQQN